MKYRSHKKKNNPEYPKKNSLKIDYEDIKNILKTD